MATDIEFLAHHEAGHAAVAVALGVRVAWIKIDPSNEKGTTRTEGTTALRDALIRLAGGRAETVLDPMSRPHRLAAIEDEVLLWEVLERHILRKLPHLDVDELDRRCDAIDDRLARCCLRLVQRRWPAIQRLAAALMERNEMTGAEAEAILLAPG